MIDRDIAQNALVQELQAHYGAAVYACVKGQPLKLEGTPIVTVLAEGSEHPPFSTQALQSFLFFSVNHFVLRVGDNWTVQDAERTLNLLEYKLQDFMTLHKGRTTVTVGAVPFTWHVLQYDTRSEVVPFNQVGGAAYELERVILRMTVFG